MTTTPQIQTIDLTKVQDNPWQPRTSLDPEQVAELAHSIEEVGLLQAPMVRMVADGDSAPFYQLAFGHYRVAALRHLGRSFADLDVRALSDADMALIALTENAKRRDVKPLEQYRAWAKVLEIDGMTIEKLAQSQGLDRSTVSNNLRLLKLPPAVLKWVDSGELSAHGAREFLCLLGADGHFHQEIADRVISKITAGAPDWRGLRIRHEISEAIRLSSPRDWRKLFEGHGGGGHAADPLFELTEFCRKNEAKLHAIPDDEVEGEWMSGQGYVLRRGKKESSRDWTCAAGAWVNAQTKAKKAGEQSTAPAASSKTSDSPVSKSKDFTKTLERDPVFVAVSAETPKKDRFTAAGGASDELAAMLGTRAAPAALKATGFKAFVGDGSYYDYSHNVTDRPSYFDNVEECRKTCTIGATWASESRGSFNLFCFNQPHFEEKVAKGKAGLVAKIERKVVAIDEADAQLRSALEAEEWTASHSLALYLASTLATLVTLQPVVPDNMPWQEREKLARWTENQSALVGLLGKKPGDMRDRRFEARDVIELKKANAETLAEILTRLLVHVANQEPALMALAKGLGAAEPEAPAPEKSNGRQPAAVAT